MADGDRTVIWTPQHGPQALLVTCPIFEIFYGGSRGGGKTDGVLGEWLGHAHRHADAASGLMVRRKRTELYDTIERSRQLYAPLGAVYNETEKQWRFPDGARLRFAYLENDSDAEVYQGHAYTRVYVEEIGNFPRPEPIMKLMATLRSAHGVPCGFRATGNPGGPGHCVPYGEVLTPSGWRDIREFEVGDGVYTVTDSGALVETKVNQVHASVYSGDMVHVSARGLSMVCTPNHRIARPGGALTEFDKLPGQATVLRAVRWNGAALGNFSPPPYPQRKLRTSNPEALSGGDFCELLGWFLAEGSAVDRDKAFDISQIKSASRERLKAFLERCGFNARWSANGARIHSARWWNYLRQFGRCRDKFIPAFVKGACQEDLQRLLDALLDGDGHRRSGTGAEFYSTSRQLADDVAEIALKCGYVVYQNSRQRANRKGLAHCVSIKLTISGGTELLTGQHIYRVKTRTKRATRITRESYHGPVYCLGIADNHRFVLRQNGSTWVSGNSWVKARYIDPAPKGYEVLTDERTGLERIYIPARVLDNPQLLVNDPQYVSRLRASGSESLVRAWLEGDWSVVMGAYFPEFSMERHVIAPFEIPKHWVRLRSMDWGSAAPFAVHWFAVSDGEMKAIPRGALVCYREWYGASAPNVGLKLTAEEVADGIAARESGEKIDQYVLDPSAFAADGGPSIAERMGTRGVYWAHADNKRVTQRGAMGGWDQLRARLKGEMGLPMICFFATCTEIIRTLPALQHDQTRPEDLDTDGEDHACDSVRYACMARPWIREAPRQPERKFEQTTQLNVNEIIAAHRRARRA